MNLSNLKPKRIVPLFLSLALIPLALVGTALVYLSYRDLSERRRLEDAHLLHRMESEILSEIRMWKSTLLLVAQGSVSDQKIRNLLRVFPDIASLRLYSRDGSPLNSWKRRGVIRTTSQELLDGPFRKMLWRQRVWQGPAERLDEGDVRLPIGAAVYSPDGESDGFIVADLSLARLARKLAAFGGRVRLFEAGREIASSAEAPLFGRQVKNRRYILELGWELELSRSWKKAYHPIFLLAVQILAGAAAVFFITVVVGVRLARKAEKEIAHRERLAAIGQMANVISHEMRTALAVIKNSMNYLKERLLEPDAGVVKHLDIVECEVKTANRILVDILTFSKLRDSRQELVDVNNLVREVAGSLPLPEYVAVKTDLAGNLPLLMVDRTEFKQAISNLLLNAGDAVQKNGLLRIKTGRDKAHIFVSVIDNGTGMDSAVQKKIFDPFFTTKVQGTGLGLAIVKRIVEKNDGLIDLKSRVGEGTAITLKFKFKTKMTPPRQNNMEVLAT